MEQPQAIENIFAIVPNEQVLTSYAYEQGACGCGPTFTVTLTNARLIERRQDCACCGAGPHRDTMLFLSDISIITDSIANKCCYLSCCTGHRGKRIGFTGAFRIQVFTFPKQEVSDALARIPTAALPHKTAKYRY